MLSDEITGSHVARRTGFRGGCSPFQAGGCSREIRRREATPAADGSEALAERCLQVLVDRLEYSIERSAVNRPSMGRYRAKLLGDRAHAARRYATSYPLWSRPSMAARHLARRLHSPIVPGESTSKAGGSSDRTLLIQDSKTGQARPRSAFLRASPCGSLSIPLSTVVPPSRRFFLPAPWAASSFH